MDFQTFGNAEFESENRFFLSFADSFVDSMKMVDTEIEKFATALAQYESQSDSGNTLPSFERGLLAEVIGQMERVIEVEKSGSELTEFF